MYKDFLFEIGCEELPFAAVGTLVQELVSNVVKALQKSEIGFESITPFATPRRLALRITKLNTQQPDRLVTRRGPALAAAYDSDGQPTKALQGFAKSCAVPVEALSVEETEKGEWLVYKSRVCGAKTRDILPDLMRQAIADLPIKKPMRWGSGDIEFARPVHWIVMLLGEEVIPCDILGVHAGQTTHGHRFLHPQGIVIEKPADYEAQLEQAFVIAGYDKRRNTIIKQVRDVATQAGAEAIMPDSLIDEVTAIVEWPQALLAEFPPEFLNVPSQALIASMQSHQKCFALQDSSGQLLPRFVAVANIKSGKPGQVIAGNEKVMRARLSDAAFFFEQDKKQPLARHIAATEKVVFQARLGTLYDKARRLQILMAILAHPLDLDEVKAKRAAELSKCDLMTGMVGEFPELQGLMGYYYARHDGEDLDVAKALNEQYLPRFSGDELPETTLGLALSLADRLDTLAGIFAIGGKPSGMKDPFKLRRHALAVVRLLMATPARLSLSGLISEAALVYGKQLDTKDASIAELQPFILERLQSFYQGRGISVDLVHAVRARQDDWLYDFDRRIHALADFVTRPEASVLSAACKRVHNLLQQAHSQEIPWTTVNDDRLENGAERELFTRLLSTEQQVALLYEQSDYKSILTQLAGLREPVDAFFDHVMVMVDNPEVKKNRLALLARLQALLQGVADISMLQLHS
ncbi:glycine--tRNA ligase subunit beta [Legionella spiritensis]|uniref:Glycine--tRNA ligase beta subunit n=1 Tax=Legionella spiritensis TaxID=452 RepID=A0A0W0YWI0_LEGSP|nr:glycine--tRNA ligase subunit beta [Legionella spiritensis]KTD61264.1 glycyl-tRNA synthetase beta chain [Legionella spiritensis]SNV33302.1 glycyl-tRNA synthetase beta chain [Legionella spiritensis]